MTSDEIFKLIGVKDTIDFVYQPIPEKVLAILNCEDDPWWDWLRDTAGKILNSTVDAIHKLKIRDKLDAVWQTVVNIFNRVIEVFDWILATPKWWIEVKFKAVIEALSGIKNYLYGELKRFLADPWGYIYDVVQRAVRPLIDGIKTVAINAWDLANKIWSKLWGWLEPKLNWLKDVIYIPIKAAIDGVQNWINSARDWIWGKLQWVYNQIYNAVSTVFNTIKSSISNALDTITASVDNVRHFFNQALGSVGEALWQGLNSLLGRIWDFFVDFFGKVGSWLKESVLEPIWKGMQAFGSWIVKIFTSLYTQAKNALWKLAPSAPEKGEELMNSAIKLLGIGAGGFAALTGVSMAVSWLSKHHLGHLSAILYDMSSYKYIAGALIGGLVFAAYTQPLKYFYNAKFRPFLPKWGEVMEAYGRSKISDDLFKFFLKYNGTPDKYFPIYKAIAARPISAFMIRYIADAEIVDPDGIFKICMDNGYSVEHAGYMAYAMSWGANAPYRKMVETQIRKCYKEGYITKERMDSEIKKAREVREVPVSYTTVDGYTYRATIKVPLDQKTLMSMAADWESFYDSTTDKVSALKTAYSKESITESEFREKLKPLIVVPERLEDIISREKAKKTGKTEPEKGKTLRDELKTVLRRCYKEGLITWEYLKSLIDQANKVVDEATLILERAAWEAFYDDRMDLIRIYKENLENGIIDEATFRRDLIDLGLRPAKVELMIKYDLAKKTGRLPTE